MPPFASFRTRPGGLPGAWARGNGPACGESALRRRRRIKKPGTNSRPLGLSDGFVSVGVSFFRGRRYMPGFSGAGLAVPVFSPDPIAGKNPVSPWRNRRAVGRIFISAGSGAPSFCFAQWIHQPSEKTRAIPAKAKNRSSRAASHCRGSE